MSDRGLVGRTGQRRRRPARVVVAAPLLAVGLLLTSCATANPGDAAVVGGTSIPQSVIGEQLRSVNEKLGLEPDTPSADGATALVYGNVVVELVRQTADRFSATVTEAQIDQYLDEQVQAAGGQDALEQTLAQQGIAPALVRDFVAATLLQQAIADRISPGGGQQEQGEALRAAVTRVADEVGVSVSPKYGVWDSEALEIVDRDDPVASPAAGIGVPSPTAVP